jgi:hypothetical protein
MSQVFQINDRVRVTSFKSTYYQFEGIVCDFQPWNMKEYKVDFDIGGSAWFEDSELTYSSTTSASIFGSQGFSAELKGIWDNTTVYSNQRCHHKWKGTKLIFTEVFDCEYCGMKKEDYDNPKFDDDTPF